MNLAGMPGNGGNSVSQNDIMKAEGVDNDEMEKINGFLKDSSHVDNKPDEEDASQISGKDTFVNYDY